MTAQTLTTPTGPFQAFFRRTGAWLRSAARTIAETGDLARAAREAERLEGLSDAELARRGIARSEIIQHAFRRYMY